MSRRMQQIAWTILVAVILIEYRQSRSLAGLRHSRTVGENLAAAAFPYNPKGDVAGADTVTEIQTVDMGHAALNDVDSEVLFPTLSSEVSHAQEMRISLSSVETLSTPRVMSSVTTSLQEQQLLLNSERMSNFNFSELPGYHTTTITHLYIPFFPAQILKLQQTLNDSWIRFPPCNISEVYERVNERKRSQSSIERQEKPRIVLMIGRRLRNETLEESQAKDVELISRVRNGISIPSQVASCFAPSLTLCVERLTPEEDTHEIGSRILFERMLQGKCIRGKRGYGLYMEPDLRPVKKNWLAQLMIQTSYPNPTRWGIGSIYRGNFYLPPSLVTARFHMNLNGLVRLSNDNYSDEEDRNISQALNGSEPQMELRRPILPGSFADFYFNGVRAFIVASNGARFSSPFDTDISRYLMRFEHFETLTGSVAHRLHFSNAFLNVPQTPYGPFTVDKFYGEGVVMVHGGEPNDDMDDETAERFNQETLTTPRNWTDDSGGIFIRNELAQVEKRLMEYEQFRSKLETDVSNIR